MTIPELAGGVPDLAAAVPGLAGWAEGAVETPQTTSLLAPVTIPVRIAPARSPLVHVGQAVALAGLLLLGYQLIESLDPEQALHEGWLPLLVLGASVQLTVALARSRVRPTRRLVPTLGTSFARTGEAAAEGAVLAALVAPLVANNPDPFIATGHVLAWSVPAVVLLPVIDFLAQRAQDGVRERVLVVGSGRVAEAVQRRLSLHRALNVVGAVDDEPEGPVIGALSDLPTLCAAYDVDRVIVAFSRTPSRRSVEVLRQLAPTIRISVVPRMFELLGWSTDLEEFDGIPLLHVPRPQLTLPNRIAKRALDLVVASVVILLSAPLVAAIAVAIKADSPGPVFFRQARTGMGGNAFRIHKFRTMRTDAEAQRVILDGVNEVDGPIFKIHDDPRVTGVGRWLRRTSLDELPQFFDVVTGTMSLVGPRPFPIAEAEQISGWPVERTSVRPGITGLWQVSGRNDLSFDDLRQLDSFYVTSWSIWSDLRIIARTPGTVLHRTGAY